MSMLEVKVSPDTVALVVAAAMRLKSDTLMCRS